MFSTASRKECGIGPNRNGDMRVDGHPLKLRVRPEQLAFKKAAGMAEHHLQPGFGFPARLHYAIARGMNSFRCQFRTRSDVIFVGATASTRETDATEAPTSTPRLSPRTGRSRDSPYEGSSSHDKPTTVIGSVMHPANLHQELEDVSSYFNPMFEHPPCQINGVFIHVFRTLARFYFQALSLIHSRM